MSRPAGGSNVIKHVCGSMKWKPSIAQYTVLNCFKLHSLQREKRIFKRSSCLDIYFTSYIEYLKHFKTFISKNMFTRGSGVIQIEYKYS